MEQLRRFCPIIFVRELGKEAIWLYQAAQQVKQSVAEMTFEEWEL